MSLARMLPTAALAGLVFAPVLIALRMVNAPPQDPNAAKKKPQPPAKAAMLAGFDGDRAYKYLVEQCDIGTRISGSEGNRTLRRRMAQHFKEQGLEVKLQPFKATHPLTQELVEMENVVGMWQPDRKNRVVIGAHFDTRPHPDEEETPSKRAEPFFGANDGGSGVAVLMELANLLPDLKTSIGVDLVAFDGEELIYDKRGEYFLGSKHFASEYVKDKQKGQYRYVAGIVLDLVGGRVLRICPERESEKVAPQLVKDIWGIAKKLKASGFKTDDRYNVSDDHLSLIDVGIPAIDIIDFSYKHWHRASDTADKCSAASLAQTGGVLAEWLRGQ